MKKADNGNYYIDEKFVNFFKNIPIQYKVTFLSTIIWAVVAHGMMFFNKYSFGDDISMLFDVGYTYTSGRWMLGFMSTLEHIFYNGSQYSMPVINGLLSVIFIAFSVCVLINLFKIKNITLCISISGVFVTFPSVIGLFGYMFTAPYYMFAFFITVVSSYIICKFRKWYTFILAVVIMACSIGIYQSYVSVFWGVIVIYIISEIYFKNYSWSEFLKNSVYYVSAFLITMILYIALNNLFLNYYHLELSDYQGLSSMTEKSFNTYFEGAIYAYKEFFIVASMYRNFNILYIYYIILFITLIYSIIILYNILKKKYIKNFIQMLIMILFIPLSVNFICILCIPAKPHSLMLYGQVMFFVYLVWLIQNIKLDIRKINNVLYCTSIVFITLISALFCRLSNVCYLKVEIHKSETISYLTTLVTRIKSVVNYDDEYPVVFINAENNKDMSLYSNNNLDSVYFWPYEINMQPMVNGTTDFMNIWVGYNPVMLDEKDFVNLPEVINMSSYPDDGSIKVIDETIVVKF